MAILKNSTGDLALSLRLVRIKDTTKWIAYELKIISNQRGITEEIFKLLNSDELYFENFAEPEVPILCSGLILIAKGETEEFVFEPIDEKDFRLEIKNENDFVTANIFLNEAQAMNDYQWNLNSMLGVRMIIKKEDIIRFSNELFEEYQTV